MEINDELLDYLSKLSRIKIHDEDREDLKKDMSKILSWMEKLKEIDTDGIEPLITMSREEGYSRKDEVQKSIDKKEALNNAGTHDDSFFLVPKVKKS